MRIRASLMAGICAGAIAVPAYAQDVTGDSDESGIAEETTTERVIIVTAQRQAQSLQEVPIAVSAFDTEALEAQQIENASDLQLTLPNVSFTKSNFTASSFTIRGIGDLCVGVSCDSATAIHLNSAPLFGTRLFETEYFDLERVEVLRGPQGTLFGRNATSGVVNVVTAKPDLSGFSASADLEYGNYNSMKAKGMINLPIGDSIGLRVAGFWLDRDGYTENLYDGNDIDDREMFAVRGSLRFEPGPDTTIDLMGYYFEEDDNRLRIQKQLCQRDPTGVLGCLNNRRDFAKTNSNSTFTGTLGSQEFFNIALGAFGPLVNNLGLNSLYGPDAYANFQEPADVRKVNTQFTPEYYSDELQLQAHLEHSFGDINLSLTGTYQETSVDSRQDYNLGVGEIPNQVAAFGTIQAYAAGAVPGLEPYFQPIVDALFDSSGNLCVSDTRLDNRGAFEGFSVCTPDGTQFDRSNQENESYSVEAIVSSDFDGSFNFLLGGIYANSKVLENSYFVNAFAIDYVTGVIGSLISFGGGLPPAYGGTSFFRNNTQDFELESFGIFGEAYIDVTDRLKITAGLRYNDDTKSIRARSTLLSFFNPYANDGDPFDPTANPLYPNGPFGPFDADPGTAGLQDVQERDVAFDEITGRFVVDYELSPDNHLYASYSRGYKSGGINPPLQPIFAVPDSFGPESIDAFEIGSKNSFLDGALQFNATAFYYKYKDLQLSRIIARTSVNDTIDADIWGLEFETIIRPDYNWLVNMNVSFLNAEVAGDQFFSNPRDPGGGDPDAVIIKDITNGALCAVTGAGANAFVAAVNGGLGLQGPTAFPSDGGIASTGAFSICSALDAQATAIGALFGGVQVLSPGVQVNLKGNKLPQAPEMKASLGVQYTAEFDNGMTLVPRFDIAFTGEQYGNVFNGPVNRIEPFVQANAQIQLNSADENWYVRGWVQNIFDSDSVTGLYVTDASSGLFSNIFTLDPRRYGIAVGAKF
ncbi:TonB-dependent receptor [Qipengyuania aquimaris]|uniref:TonB-dependent receptor n=1 Tax=Qipengyuania aquimaris TaxID=255984 RepID=A0A9Q3S1L4_9SPHN|nr:TonB-dependent receptor [Qipengyuania aquimaris]MBY6218509.1 TonB-dependent receptor [Qipengyuania aquimaris]